MTAQEKTSNLYFVKNVLKMDVYYQVKIFGNTPTIVNPVYWHSDIKHRNFNTGFTNFVTIDGENETGEIMYSIWCKFMKDTKAEDHDIFIKRNVPQRHIMYWLKQFYSAAALISQKEEPKTVQDVLDSKTFDDRYKRLKYLADTGAADREA